MKIIDTFTFFNELTLLELRLNTLHEYVDEFILVEATRSHQNKPKPLYYQENKELFLKFNHKITHVIVDEYPVHDYWSYEAHQRDVIASAILKESRADDDVIFISDLDEIWNPEIITPYLKDLSDTTIYKWQSLICYFYFNLIASPGFWVQPLFLRYSLFKNLINNNFKITADILRDNDKRMTIQNEIIPGLGGWHFSYTEDPVYKLQNFLHSEYNGMTREQLQQAINNKINPFHRNQMNIFEGDLSAYLPKYVLQHLDKYDKFIIKQ